MKKVLASVAIASLLFSCSEKPDTDKSDSDRIPLDLSVTIKWSKDTDKNFQTGAEIGVYVVNYNGSDPDVLKSKGNQADNVRFVYDGSDWNTNEEVFLKGDNASACYVYYPYTSSIASPTEYLFSVQKDQSIKENYDASNFLWGDDYYIEDLWGEDGVVVSKKASISTESLLAGFVIHLYPGNGFTEDTWNAAIKSVRISGVKTSAIINLSTGVVTATGNAGEIIPLATSEDEFEAVTIPQEVADNSKFIVINVDGIDYIYYSGYDLKPSGKQWVSLAINKTEGTVERYFR